MCSISLDQILERVSVGPLLCVGRPVSDSGEVTEAETVLHALLATRLLLLVALNIKKQTKKNPNTLGKITSVALSVSTGKRRQNRQNRILQAH